MKDWEESCVSSPRCELLPQKRDFTVLSGFLAACAEACCQEQRGACSGAGSRPFPGQACQDCSSQTAPHPQHSTAMALPPHTCNKHVSPQGLRCVFRCCLPSNRWFSNMEPKKNNSSTAILGKEHHFCQFGKPKELSPPT